MSRVLLIAALVCALILTLLGFGVFTASDPKLFGWLGATLTLWLAAELVP